MTDSAEPAGDVSSEYIQVIIMLSKQEFLDIYIAKSVELTGSEPDPQLAEEKFFAYKELAEGMGEDADLKFVQKEDGSLGIHYCFDNPDYRQPSQL